MVAVNEISWEEASAPGFEHTTRKAFRAVVDQVAARAKATLPECNGRVEKAVAIVLQGDVELLPDGHARVASQCQGTLVYRIVNGTCDCPDFPKAPSSWCKHRVGRRHPAARHAGRTDRGTDVLYSTRAVSGRCDLPLAGSASQCQLPRDDRWPAGPGDLARHRRRPGCSAASRRCWRSTRWSRQPPARAQTSEGWCQVHQVQMHRNEKDGRSWWSHKAEDGSWCKGTRKGQGR